MKWFRDSAEGQPRAAAKRTRSEKQHSRHTKAGARAKRAPAKKHLLRNRVRALLGKPPLAETPPRRTRLFTQMLLSFICLTAVTSLIAGMLNVTLVRNYVQDSSMETLLDRAADIAELMQRPGGSLKVINVQ